MSKEEASSLESLQTWLWKLQRDSSTDDEEFLDDNSKAYLHSFRDNFTRYSLFLVWPHAMFVLSLLHAAFLARICTAKRLHLPGRE